MPAWRVNHRSLVLRQYDVGGVDSPHVASSVQHLVLSQEERADITKSDAFIAAVHMGPPLRSTPRLAYAIDSFGTVSLEPGEIRQVMEFVDERLLEFQAQRKRTERPSLRRQAEDQYIIDPASKEPDSSKPYWRFSCAGFVMEAYSWAGLQLLVDRNTHGFPTVTVDRLKEAYPSHADDLEDPDFRARMGLIGDGPWAVVLAGYIINALNRISTDIRSTPYLPNQGDCCFPSQTQA
jgi:hypothetical protein